MFEYRSQLKLETSKTKLEAELQRLKLQQRATSLLLPALQAWDGKVVNKRLETHLKPALAPFTISLGGDPSFQRKLTIWTNGLAWPDALTVYLPRGERFAWKDFIRPNGPDGVPLGERTYAGPGNFLLQADACVAQAEATLANLPALLKAYNTALEALAVAENAFGPCGRALNR